MRYHDGSKDCIYSPCFIGCSKLEVTQVLGPHHTAPPGFGLLVNWFFAVTHGCRRLPIASLSKTHQHTVLGTRGRLEKLDGTALLAKLRVKP